MWGDALGTSQPHPVEAWTTLQPRGLYSYSQPLGFCDDQLIFCRPLAVAGLLLLYGVNLSTTVPIADEQY